MTNWQDNTGLADETTLAKIYSITTSKQSVKTELMNSTAVRASTSSTKSKKHGYSTTKIFSNLNLEN